MKLFLDSSTMLAASGSATGASRLLVKEAFSRGWHLLSSLYCLEETRRNLGKLGPKAVRDFESIVAPRIEYTPTTVVADRPFVSAPGFTGHEELMHLGLVHMTERGSAERAAAPSASEG